MGYSENVAFGITHSFFLNSSNRRRETVQRDGADDGDTGTITEANSTHSTNGRQK